MSETLPPPTPAPSPPPPNPMLDQRQMALVIYVLYLVPTGVTHIVGLVLAYVSRDTAPEWLRSHYTLQIRTFWIGLLLFAVSVALCITIIGIIIGVPLMLATLVWFIVRCALGLARLLRNEPYPTPQNWVV